MRTRVVSSGQKRGAWWMAFPPADDSMRPDEFAPSLQLDAHFCAPEGHPPVFIQLGRSSWRTRPRSAACSATRPVRRGPRLGNGAARIGGHRRMRWRRCPVEGAQVAEVCKEARRRSERSTITGAPWGSLVAAPCFRRCVEPPISATERPRGNRGRHGRQNKHAWTLRKPEAYTVCTASPGRAWGVINAMTYPPAR